MPKASHRTRVAALRQSGDDDQASAMAMIAVASGVRVWLAAGHTDMRRGFDGQALLVQETLK